MKYFRASNALTAMAALATLAFAAPASAGPLVNGSFEFAVANAFGWTTSPTFDVFVDSGGAAPGQGLYGARVKADTQNVYTTLTQTFDMSAGDTLTGWVRWRGLDSGGIYNDDGYLKINTTVLATYSINLSGNITTPWVQVSYVAPSTGSYTLQAGARNIGDGATGVYASEVHVDGFAVSAVPEPQAAALMLAGLAGLSGIGALRRLRQRRG